MVQQIYLSILTFNDSIDLNKTIIVSMKCEERSLHEGSGSAGYSRAKNGYLLDNATKKNLIL